MREFKIRASHTTTVKPYSPFRYPGGKSWLAPQIRYWLSSRNYTQLVEPFAGGASVSLYALFDGLVDNIHINELDEDVYNFWFVAINHAPEICFLIENFVPEEESTRKLAIKWKNRDDVGSLSKVERAFMTLLRNRLARNGVMTDRSGFLRNGDRNGLFSRWYPETMVRRIKNIAEARHAITLSNQDGMQIIRSRRYRSSAIFIDPPYVEAGKLLYKHNKILHSRVFQFASERGSDVLITYDKTPTIMDLTHKFGLDCVEIDMMSGGNIRKAELMISKDLDWSEVFND